MSPTETTPAPLFEQVLRRSHLRLLARTFLVLSALCALSVTAALVAEQTRWGTHAFLTQMRASTDYLRATLKGADRDTVDAVLSYTARVGVAVPYLNVGGTATEETASIVDAFGLRFAYMQSLPQGYLQWIEDGRRYSVGPMRQIGPVPKHWQQALMSASDQGVVLEEPATSPLQKLRFAEGGLDTLLVPVDPARAVAFVVPRTWIGLGGIIIFASASFIVVWVVCLVVFGLPALAISYLQVRREAHAVAQPLQRLTAAAEALQHGRVLPDLPLQGALEIRQLAAAFNDMSSKLIQARCDIEASRDALQQTLDQQRELFVNISHDLRTPLAAIAGYAEVLERDHPKLRAAGVIRREAASMTRLVDDIFELARLEDSKLSLDMRAVLVRDVLAHAQQAYAKQAWDRGVLLNLAECSAEAQSAKVSADPQRLAQILGNLISNAIRHTPPGGLIDLAAQADRNQVRLTVTDTGLGIALDDLPHVFERSFRGDRARRDSSEHRHAGLGLAIARELARAMGGDLQVEATGKAGSTFAITLQRAADT